MSRLLRARLLRARLLRACLVCLACLHGLPGMAASTALLVQATILPFVTVRVQSAPDRVHVSVADLARGYVDLPLPLSLAVRSNLVHGVVLTFSVDPALVRRIEVHGSLGEQAFGPTGAALQLPRVTGLQLVDVRLRFWLVPQATAGDHPWPVHVAASA